MGTEPDYYTMLGVTQSASQDEVRHAYHALARRYHPDSRTDEVETARFHEVQVAYSILTDPAQRRAYDRRRQAVSGDEKSLMAWDVLVSNTKLFTGYEQQVLYALIEVRQGTSEVTDRLPLNLCLVIDRSTSMQGERLACVKAAASQALDDLKDDDTISIVVFSDTAEVLLPNQTVGNRRLAKAKITSISARGGTEILQGLSLGLTQLRKRHGTKVNSHLILLTDGRTYGDDDMCVSLSEQAGEEHIGITTIGIGEDWNEVLLDEMGKRSGGVSVYVSSPNELQAVLRRRMRSLAGVFAQNVKLALESIQGTALEKVFKVSPSLERLRVNDGVVNLGTLQSNAPLVVVMELATGAFPAGKHRLACIELSADFPARGGKKARLQYDLLVHFTDTLAEFVAVPTAIISALRKATLYEMQQRAWDALERGETDAANRQLELVATRLFDLGEPQLAQAAMVEAGRIVTGAPPSLRGQKQLKYGTRSLSITSWGESND